LAAMLSTWSCKLSFVVCVIVLSFIWLISQNVKVSKGKASKDQAQSHSKTNVN